MDNLCHTLVGLAMGEAGLKTKTRYGNAALMIAANIPDIDVRLSLPAPPWVNSRGGGPPGMGAQWVLRVLITAAFVAIDGRRGRRAGEAAPPLHVGWLLAL